MLPLIMTSTEEQDYRNFMTFTEPTSVESSINLALGYYDNNGVESWIDSVVSVYSFCC